MPCLYCMWKQGRAELWALNSIRAGVWMPAHLLPAGEPNFLQHRHPLPCSAICICGQTVSGGEHTVLPGTSVLTLFPACMWVCVCVCVCVCAPPPVHMHIPSQCSSPPSGVFNLWKSKPSHRSYSYYKRTQVCHFTKNPRALWTGHLPRTSDIRLELQKTVSVSLSGNTSMA